MAKRWGAWGLRRHTRGRGYPGTHKNNRFSRAMMDNGVVCFLWVPASAGMTLTMCGMALMMCGMALMMCGNGVDDVRDGVDEVRDGVDEVRE